MTITHKEMLRRAHKAFKEKYGVEKYQEMQAKSAEAQKAKDPNFGNILSLKGRLTLAKRYFDEGKIDEPTYQQRKQELEAQLKTLSPD